MSLTKKIINTCIWKLNDEYQVKAYTALWCAPCRKVKPDMINYMQDYQIREISFIYSDDPDKPEFVPFFKIINTKQNETIDSIQSSDINEIKDMISKYINL